MKNKRLNYGLLCAAIAFLLLAVGVPLFISSSNKSVEVVRVTSHITKGEMITADMVEIAKVGAANLPTSVMTELDDVVGKYAVVDFLGNEMVLSTHVNETPLTTDLSALPSNKFAISFTVQSFAAGVSDKLLAGDIIRVYHVTSADGSSKKVSNTIEELQYVKVLAVTNADGQDIQSEKVNEEGETVVNHASTITILATQEQAELLARLEYDGNLHAALVYRGDAENVQKYVDKQDALLKEIAASANKEANNG